MVTINIETFLVCFIKHRLSKSHAEGNELGSNVLFTCEDLLVYRASLRESSDIDCPYSLDEITEVILQYPELFEDYETADIAMYDLVWDKIYYELDGNSIIDYLLFHMGIKFLPESIKSYLGILKEPDGFDLSKVPSNAISEIIVAYERCKNECKAMRGSSDEEIVSRLLGSYNETIVSMALKYSKECI